MASELAPLQGARALAHGMLRMHLVKLMIHHPPTSRSPPAPVPGPCIPFSDTDRRLPDHFMEVRMALPNKVEERMMTHKFTVRPDSQGASFCRTVSFLSCFLKISFTEKKNALLGWLSDIPWHEVLCQECTTRWHVFYMDMWHLPPSDMHNVYLCTTFNSNSRFTYLKGLHKLINGCAIHLLCACVLSCFCHVWLFVTPWAVAHPAHLSVGFPRQEYWSECHALLQGIFLTQESDQHLLWLLNAGSFLITEPLGKSYIHYTDTLIWKEHIFSFKFFSVLQRSRVLFARISENDS